MESESTQDFAGFPRQDVGSEDLIILVYTFEDIVEQSSEATAFFIMDYFILAISLLNNNLLRS